jgi:hypothetical protein
VINALAWFLFYRSLDKPKALRTNAFSNELLNKIKKSNYLAFAIYTATAVLAIWFPYIALIINVAVWLLWVSLSLIEKE